MYNLSDLYTQPIGVFASRGPVNGLTLVKLMIKAVILLENAGCLCLRYCIRRSEN